MFAAERHVTAPTFLGNAVWKDDGNLCLSAIGQSLFRNAGISEFARNAPLQGCGGLEPSWWH